MYHISNSGNPGNSPLHERVRHKQLAYGDKVHIAEYHDSPEETFRRITYLVRDSQENVAYVWDLREWALSIVRQSGATTQDEMIVAIYDWVKQNMLYVRDPAYNELIHSSEVLMHRYISGQGLHGDCDDFTILICSLLLALGITCRARMIKLPYDDGSVNYAHIYPMARLSDGDWIALDATEANEPIGWEPPNWGVKDFTF